MITRTDIAAHLERGVRTGFLISQSAYTPLRKPFCGVKPSDGAAEDYAGMGASPWPVQNSGKAGNGGTDGRTGVPVNGGMNSGRQITIVGAEEQGLRIYNLDFEIAFGITHNAINDDKTGELLEWANAAGSNFEKHKDYMAFNALNNGELTTVLGPGYDGLSLFNDAHIDPGALYQTAQDNKYALVLTGPNFNTVKIAASKFMDSRGQPLGLTHSLLIHPPDLAVEAAQITTNPQDYSTANRAINPNAGKTSSLEAPGAWLDSTAWFIVDPSEPIKPLYIQDRQAPQLAIWDVNEAGDGGVRYYKWHARYNIMPGDWRKVIEGNS
jgi:hypothetical protein